jgi:geranylgeranyl reductase family protein
VKSFENTMKNASLPSKTDVLIVGGGPAGSTLAYSLARLGIDVLILEKAKFPRGKTCGGAVNVRAVRLLPFDLEPVVEGVIKGISFTRNLEEPISRRYAEPLMVTVRREYFDDFLVQQAKQAGARFFDETQFLSLQPKEDVVEVETSSGTILAKFVIGADGAQSAVAKKLDLMQKTAHMLAIHSEVPTSVLPWHEPDTIHIDWGSLRGTYAYLFPKKNSLSMGAGGIGVPAAKIKKYQRAFLVTRWQKEQDPPFSTAGFLLPLRQKRRPIQKGRCLLLGDAAGLIDPLTGEGIYYAIRGAQLAAPALADALKSGGNSLAPCQQVIDRDLMPELECAVLVREIFNLRPSYFHHKMATSDRWWNAMAKILRGERTFVDVKKKLGLLGSLLLRIVR